MSLYLKYRPKTLDEIYGNEEAVASLKGLLSDIDECPHVFLFHGPTGCGKTTFARIIASELNCTKQGVIEINSSDFRGIDTVRDIIRSSEYLPLDGNNKIYIIDECHKLTNDAQNALLKILEDTPKHVYFVLCTTEPNKLIPAIRGRCLQFQVKPLSDLQMLKLLKRVTKAENEKLEREIYDQIVQDSLGHPRNALQILGQVLKTEPSKRIEIAKQTAEEQSKTIELCRALINSNSWKLVAGILNGLRDQDCENIRRNVLGYCQTILLKKENDRAAFILEQFIEPFYNSGWPGLTLACYTIINGGQHEL